MEIKKNIQDIAVEVSNEDDLFFSITNQRGNILLANTTFCKISGYTLDELKGSPHSIVRHPDMPKILFELMWDTIKAGNPFGGYIKNLAADGRFYWVFALVVPVDQSYLSIRILPKVQKLSVVENLYQRLSNIEKESMLEAEKELNHWILSKDFINYHAWASSCLASEIEANISISSRSFPDKLERLSFRPSTKTDLIANQTLNHIFKGYKFMHRNFGEWLKKTDIAIDLLFDFQSLLMVLNRELYKKIRNSSFSAQRINSLSSFNPLNPLNPLNPINPLSSLNPTNLSNLSHSPNLTNNPSASDDFKMMENYRANLRFLFEVLKRLQFQRSSVLLHLSSMNFYIVEFFDHLKNVTKVNVPFIIDSIESLKTLTKSLLYFPNSTLQDKVEISEQIKSHFECIDQIIQNLQKNEISLDKINGLVAESKEKGMQLLIHYETFDSKTLQEATSFYQLLISNELVLEGVSNYAV